MTLTVTPAELRKDLDALIKKVERGDELHVVAPNATPVKNTGLSGLQRDVLSAHNPFLEAEIKPSVNRTVIGEDVGKGEILGPIEGPIIPESDWHCLSDAADHT